MGFLEEVRASKELIVNGVKYRFKFNKVRKHIGHDVWSLVARYSNGKWVIV